MKKSSLLFAVIFFFLVCAVASAQEFSADIVSTSAGHSFQGKIFVAKDKVRMEMPEAVTISRVDKKVVWMLMPAQQMYMEQPLDPKNIPATAEKAPGEIKREFLGPDMVDGKAADKYRVSYETNGRQWTMLQWIAKGMSMPIKSAAENGSWMFEYRNIKMGAQPATLFEVPAGYRKFSMGSSLPGGLGDLLK